MRQAQSVTLHPDWDRSTFNNDFAVVKLTSSVLVNGFGDPTDFEPIEYNKNPNNPRVFEDVRVMGFGVFDNDIGIGSPFLLEAYLRFVNDAECGRFWEDDLFPDTMLCTIDDEDVQDSCQGEQQQDCQVRTVLSYL